MTIQKDDKHWGGQWMCDSGFKKVEAYLALGFMVNFPHVQDWRVRSVVP